MEFVRLAKTSDFGAARIKSFRLLGKPVGIVRNRDGSFFATEIACKHQNADLSTGTIDGDVLTCPRHGWRYDLNTGECLNHESSPLRRYALRVDGEDIYVSLSPASDERDA